MAFARLLDRHMNCTFSESARQADMYKAHVPVIHTIFSPNEMWYAQICCLKGDALKSFLDERQVIVPTEDMVNRRDFIVLHMFQTAELVSSVRECRSVVYDARCVLRLSKDASLKDSTSLMDSIDHADDVIAFLEHKEQWTSSRPYDVTHAASRLATRS